VNGVEFDVVRYYLEGGNPVEERITFRDTDPDDDRVRPIPIDVLAMVGADGIDKPWVWIAASNPGFDTPVAIVVGEESRTDLDGNKIVSERWAFPPDSEYWDVLNLPPRLGVMYVHRDTYVNAVSSRIETSARSRKATDDAAITRRQRQWDLQRRIHSASGLKVEDTHQLIGARPR
jgi:hypothetical protein